ncbi:SET domain-containing protein [Thalassovita sp.]|uniref:SET domain-containing protein n=1 Tax=Thalassovita sp. TaxID=1979401 RepID=UPI0029DE6D9C|nr:SET domain-containing protein-lysine N-methyltransferase [Thalassovita sp.]
MMMVRCYLGPSQIEGLGVFSHVNIRKGALVWLFDPRFDSSFFTEDRDHVPAHFREFLDRHTFQHPTDPERIVLECDEGRFMNHADLPNVDMTNPARGVALRDIAAGEELTRDYTQFAAQPRRPRTRSPSPIHAAE